MDHRIIDDYPSMTAADYWRMRGERTFPATCRLTAQWEQIPPEELGDYFTRFVHTNYDHGVRYIQGYPERNI
jgi:hypothetical protein